MQKPSLGFKSITTLLSLVLWCSVSLAQGEKGQAEDERAIRGSVNQMMEAWNAKDGVQYGQPFATDADYVVINGRHAKGRKQIAENHQRIFDSVFKDSTLSIGVKQIRFLRSDVALVHVTGTNTFKTGTETTVVPAIMTLVMTRENGGWTIAAFQNTEIQK